MFLLALSVYVFFLIGYGVFIFAVLAHIKKYRAPGVTGDNHVRTFVVIIALLAILSLVAFINVPWNAPYQTLQ